MPKSIVALLLILASVSAALVFSKVIAQVYPGQPPAVALTCAYNSGGPPTPTAGKFYYIQCNSSGQIIVE